MSPSALDNANDKTQNSQTLSTSTPPSTLTLHQDRHSLPPPPPSQHGHRRVIRFPHKSVKHPGRVDRDRRYGPVHVHPPPQGRLRPHRLQPHPLQGPASSRPRGPPGRLPKRRRLQIRRRLFHRRLPLRRPLRPPRPHHRRTLRTPPRRHPCRHDHLRTLPRRRDLLRR
ncbi:hypothetical protein ACFX2I_026376 [Malus domestica]